jgi:hypothetical protein
MSIFDSTSNFGKEKTDEPVSGDSFDLEMAMFISEMEEGSEVAAAGQMCDDFMQLAYVYDAIKEHGMSKASFAALDVDGSLTAMLAQRAETSGETCVTIESIEAVGNNEAVSQEVGEAIGDTLKNWGAAFKKFFLKIKAHVMNLIDRFLTAQGRLEAAVGKLLDKESSISSADTKKFDKTMKIIPKATCEAIFKDVNDGGSLVSVGGKDTMEYLKIQQSATDADKTKGEDIVKKIDSIVNKLTDEMKKAKKGKDKATLKEHGYSSGKDVVDALKACKEVLVTTRESSTIKKGYGPIMDGLAGEAEAANRLDPKSDGDKIKKTRDKLAVCRMIAGASQKLIAKRVSITLTCVASVVKVAKVAAK